MFTIICDTREQQNTHLIEKWTSKVNLIHRKLDYGDYSFILNDESYENKLVIERKGSLDELALNFTLGRERFKKEMLRAKEHKSIIILLIENATMQNIMNHDYISKFHPNAFIGSLNSWKEKYNLWPIFSLKKNSANIIYQIFNKYLINNKIIV